MIVVVQYLWPMVLIGVAVGLVAGLVTRQQRKRRPLLMAAAVVAVLGASSWHALSAKRFAARIETQARDVLHFYEMDRVDARLLRGPLSRQLLLSGPADDFQRGELVRVMGLLPGVSAASWSKQRRGLPLIAEAAGSALVGFLIGLLLAQLIEVRRRNRASWE